ncbi:MAG TPA: phosphate ABC transporter permease subunit PstC [Mycobacteriales bacterium]|nr:phosphate ABC transporter permease subunit PstC [Mycobacteriales bacterium]
MTAPTEATEPLSSRVGGESAARGDRVFFALTGISGAVMVATIVAIGVFLVVQALPALHDDSTNPLTTKVFTPEAARPTWGIAVLAFGTVLTSLLAMVLAVPVALGVAIFVTQLAPRRLAGLLGGLVDLLAAVPSVVYGLWGVAYLNTHLQGFNRGLHGHLGWVPLFGDTGGRYSKSILLAAIVLAIMVLPIIAALSREVLLQVPEPLVEGALALGATRWEAVRTAVLPPSRPGIVSAVMLGLGRALGETIAVALVLGFSPEITARILGPGGNTIAANIATKFGEYSSDGRGALIATGLVLFVITFVVNAAARAIVIRSARRNQA